MPGREPGIAGESVAVTRRFCVWCAGAQRVRSVRLRLHLSRASTPHLPDVARRTDRSSAAHRPHQSPPPSVVRKMVPLLPTAVPVFASVNDTSRSQLAVPLVCVTHVAPLCPVS